MQPSARGGRRPLIREVLHFPDPALKLPSEFIDPHDGFAQKLIADLLDTMRAHSHCVGLAAPQIGVNLRAFVVDVSRHPKTTNSHGEVALLNPEIILAQDHRLAREGCMSVPSLTGDVTRAGRLVVRAQTPDAEFRTFETQGFEARAFQHEIDHLYGRLFLDRVQSHRAVFLRKSEVRGRSS